MERPTELWVSDLRLDPASRRAWRGETELELSTKEFALLRLLFLSNPGVVLSRDRILQHVWDHAYDGGSNVIDQYVMYLRRQIDRPFKIQQLETVRGAGYRLREHPNVEGGEWAQARTARAPSHPRARPGKHSDVCISCARDDQC
jgi:two-component system OmpR family response regulator